MGRPKRPGAPRRTFSFDRTRPLPPEKRRDHRIVVSVTAAEHAALLSKAQATGLSLSTYVRLLLVSGVTGM